MKSKLLVTLALVLFLLTGLLLRQASADGGGNAQIIKKGQIVDVVENAAKPYFVLKVDGALQYLRPDSVPNWVKWSADGKTEEQVKPGDRSAFKNMTVDLFYKRNMDVPFQKTASFDSIYKLDKIRMTK
jgi:hypothetical protein